MENYTTHPEYKCAKLENKGNDCQYFIPKNREIARLYLFFAETI